VARADHRGRPSGHGPAIAEDIGAAEAAVGCRLPEELSALLLRTQVTWGLERFLAEPPYT
jgi:hypothetical protein